MALSLAQPVTHASVLRIALPITLANMSEPMIGVVNTAVMGRLPEPFYIAGVAVGALIFSFIFWGFGFLRLSTGGLAAQATGANDAPTLVTLLCRSLILAAVIGLILTASGPWLGPFAVRLVGGSAEVMREAEIYVSWRILSAPGAMVNYALLGWFIGQGRTRTAFVIQLGLNLSNMMMSIAFVNGLHMLTAGVGLAVVVAEYAAAVLGLALAFRHVARLGVKPIWTEIFRRDAFLSLIAANRDIMIRTFALVFAFAWFTSRGARQGDLVVAANAVVLHLFEVSAFMMDGFAYAAEALVGQSIGAMARERYRKAVVITSLWAAALGVLCGLVILLFGDELVAILTLSPQVREAAGHYLYWAALAVVLGTACFQFDGIFTGAMATRDMRNMMLLALAIYLAVWSILEPAYGNHGLWAALVIFFVARGVAFAARMTALERRAFG